MISKVDENLYRGPRPGTPAAFDELQKLGIKSILNLEGGLWGWIDGDQNFELALAFEYDMHLNHIQMGAVVPPSDQQMDLALSIIMDRKEPLYVHCLEGRDRTGMVIAAYRMMACEFTLEQAILEMESFNFHSYYFYWLPRLRKWNKL